MMDKYEELEKWEFVQNKMIQEGFHYCFEHYSNFDEIKDDKFHELRLKYLESSKELRNYINTKTEELMYSANDND